MSNEFAFAPTAAQTTAMTEIKASMPGVHWSHAWNQLRSGYPDDFQDNDHDIYVVANYYASIAVAAPAVTALTPATGPAGADILVDINGTGFGLFATVNIGEAHSLAPSSVSPTDLKVLFSGAAHIAYPGVLPVSVTNGDGQTSNALDFTVT
jgi:IPT/TIG domain